ncbi:MAG: HlyD family efflux transporter periplasmic adaptor subunit [Candidatus Pacebacteria bacterium]|nr:HlyD family efflux transporter periplasmic adaptor subunit [Candidatus Paceibacterota bacterium]
MKNLKSKLTKSNLKYLIPGLVVLLIAGVLIIRHLSAPQSELVLEQPQIRDLTQILEVSGVVDAKTKARMRFLAGGKVTYLGAKEGDWVKKWQTIATIDQRTLQKQLDKSLNDYMIERWDWEQTQDNIEDRWIPKSEERDVDQEQWQLENEVLDVEIQSLAIANTVMSAPFAGVLVESPIDTSGVQVLATDYFELVDPASLIFRAEVDEEDVARLELNQSAEIMLDAYPELLLPTQVEYIAYKSAQSSSGTVFLIELPINQPDLNKYRLGMNGDAAIELARKEQVLSIPLIATKERDGEFFVEVASSPNTSAEQTVEKQVQVGLETDRYLEVTAGLTENDWVVIPQSD